MRGKFRSCSLSSSESRYNQKSLPYPLPPPKPTMEQQMRQIFENLDSGSEAESPNNYGKNGFHPVYLGELFKNNKYEVVQKLGYGTFSTVWLVREIKSDKFFALKISKSSPVVQEQALDEYQILRALKENKNNPTWLQVQKQQKINSTFTINLIENFPHFGVNGTHYCSVFEVLGPTLLDVIRYHEEREIFMSIQLVKIITRQILFGLVYIHDVCGVIHTDIKPENVMLELTARQKSELINKLRRDNHPPLSERILLKKGVKYAKKRKFDQKLEELVISQTRQDVFLWKGIEIDLDTTTQIQLVDFGNSCWKNKKFTDNIQTLEYRSPEAILKAPYDQKADIWSLGCLIFEMLTNTYLFKPEATEEYAEEDEHLAMIIETFGPIPSFLIEMGRDSPKLIEPNGTLKNFKEPLKPSKISQILIDEYRYDKKLAQEINNFLTPIMEIDPRLRKNARDILLDKWLWT